MSEARGPGRSADDVQRIKAEALGEPGNRRFRLLALVEGETRIVWLEKEQLRRLGDALGQVLVQLPGRPSDAAPADSGADFARETRSQFRAGRMELGYDEERDRLIIVAHDIEAEADDAPAFACRISRGQAQALIEEAAALIAAGRPLCPLCGGPIGADPHVCAKQNGHFPARLEEVQSEDQDA